jgi:hypothetical protein
MLWNGLPASSGIGGWDQPESVDRMVRNMQYDLMILEI